MWEDGAGELTNPEWVLRALVGLESAARVGEWVPPPTGVADRDDGAIFPAAASPSPEGRAAARDDSAVEARARRGVRAARSRVARAAVAAVLVWRFPFSFRVCVCVFERGPAPSPARCRVFFDRANVLSLERESDNIL